MLSIPAYLALLEPPASRAVGPWLNPKYLAPEYTIPLGAATLIFLIILVLKAPDIASWHRARGKQTLDPIQAEELMLGTPPQVVDLRTRQEFIGPKGHIRNAISLPMSELVKRMDELDTSHPRAFLLVDETDKISHEAVALFSARGHRWVYVLKGGMRAWRRARLPVYVIQGKTAH